MDDSLKISVITTLFKNDIVFLEKCYKSLKKQMVGEFEWIIVCNSEIAIDLNTLDGIKVNIVQENIKDIAINKARNIGINIARGEYIYFLDIDDYIYPHTLLSLYTCVNKENAKIVRGGIEVSHLTPLDNYKYQERVNELQNNQCIDYEILDIKNADMCHLNALISRSFIKENEINFDESLESGTDIGFMAQIYDSVNSVIYDKDAMYVKMDRSDTVRYPSLTTRNKLSNVIDIPKRYISIISKIRNIDVVENLDKYIVKIYCKESKLIYSSVDGSKDRNIIEVWAKAFSLINSDGAKEEVQRKLLIKKEFNLLKKLEISEANSVAQKRLYLMRVNKFCKSSLKSKAKVFVERLLKLFAKLPINKKIILFESFLGKNMSDSPKYIYKYLSENYPGKFKFIWVFNEKRNDLPDDVIQVKRFSVKHLYYIATSKFWVSNMRQPKWYTKREGQIFLSCWHGTPLKKLVFDMNEVHSASKTYKQDFYEQSRKWDYLISANRYSTEIFKRAFLFDKPILELGYPRNDLLHYPNKEEIALKLKDKLGIPKDKKIVCYCPTWRDDEYYKPGKYKFKLQLDLKRLHEELGDEYFFILRTHYFIADSLDIDGLEGFVYNASKYDDVTELYLISDALITDYSSVFFDYANLKRPIMFFAYDLEKYRDTLRGFYLDIEKDCPGPIVKTNDEIIEKLKDFKKLKEDYKEKLDAFYDEFCYLEDGNASERIAEEIIIKNMK